MSDKNKDSFEKQRKNKIRPLENTIRFSNRIRKINNDTNQNNLTNQRANRTSKFRPISRDSNISVKEMDMLSFLDKEFPEYKLICDKLGKIFADGIKENFDIKDANNQKSFYNKLRSFLISYIYGLVKGGYITEENKGKILERFNSIKKIGEIKNGIAYGNTTGNMETGYDICLQKGIEDKILEKAFYHEFSHVIIGENLTYENRGKEIKKFENSTENTFWLKCLIRYSNMEELFAQDTAEEIYSIVHDIPRRENDFSMYSNIQKLGILFSKTINGCKSIKDLVKQSFSDNFITNIVNSYKDMNDLQKILTSFQNIQLPGSVSRSIIKREKNKRRGFKQISNQKFFNIDDVMKEEFCVSGVELEKLLEKNTKKARMTLISSDERGDR